MIKMPCPPPPGFYEKQAVEERFSKLAEELWNITMLGKKMPPDEEHAITIAMVEIKRKFA